MKLCASLQPRMPPWRGPGRMRSTGRLLGLSLAFSALCLGARKLIALAEGRERAPLNCAPFYNTPFNVAHHQMAHHYIIHHVKPPLDSAPVYIAHH